MPEGRVEGQLTKPDSDMTMHFNRRECGKQRNVSRVKFLPFPRVRIEARATDEPAGQPDATPPVHINKNFAAKTFGQGWTPPKDGEGASDGKFGRTTPGIGFADEGKLFREVFRETARKGKI